MKWDKDHPFHTWAESWGAIMEMKKKLERNDNFIIAEFHKMERNFKTCFFWIFVWLIFDAFLLFMLLRR